MAMVSWTLRFSCVTRSLARSELLSFTEARAPFMLWELGHPWVTAATTSRGSVNESNSDLASDLVTHENRNVQLTIAIEIAALVERVYPIIPLILSLELSAQYLKSPPWQV